MKQLKKEISEEYLDKIISAAYGDGNIFSRIKIYLDARKDERIKEILMQYKSTAETVRDIAKENYQTSQKIKPVSKHPFTANALRFIIFKPAISSAVAAVFIILVISVSLLRKPEPQPEYSKAQVEQAEKQVKESFAIVASVLKKSSNEITNGVLKKKVGGQLQKGVSIINGVLTERIEQ